MSSKQISLNKSAKFNYLIQDGKKQKLIGCYESLNFQPTLYKRNYETNSVEKDKQNLRLNKKIDVMNGKQLINKNYNQNYDFRANGLNHRLCSFSKSLSIEEKDENMKQNQLIRHIEAQQECIQQKKDLKRNQAAKRGRNRSFGNFSNKRNQFQSLSQNKQKTKKIQFSPYKEERHQNYEFDSKQQREAEWEVKMPDRRRYESQQKLLIYEIQEQQQIVKQQLKEFEYQNQLLRQKISYLESENLNLKSFTNDFKKQTHAQQILYREQIHTQTVKINQLESQIISLHLLKDKFQAQLTQDKYLIADLEHQLNSLTIQINDLQLALKAKESQVALLKTNLQRISVDQQIFSNPKLNKRRRSVDFSLQNRRSQNKSFNQLDPVNFLKYSSAQLAQDLALQNKNGTINGKLMNKTLPLGINQKEELKTTDKQQNFIDSIKSMYFKITGRNVKDLKQLWKWLKSIAHQYQDFVQLYSIKQLILTVMHNFQLKEQDENQCKQISKREKDCYKIIKRVSQIVNKNPKFN